MNIFIQTVQRSASVQTTGSDAVVIAHSAIWLVLHSRLQRNKSVYRLDSRPSPRVRGSGFARLRANGESVESATIDNILEVTVCLRLITLLLWHWLGDAELYDSPVTAETLSWNSQSYSDMPTVNQLNSFAGQTTKTMKTRSPALPVDFLPIHYRSARHKSVVWRHAIRPEVLYVQYISYFKDYVIKNRFQVSVKKWAPLLLIFHSLARDPHPAASHRSCNFSKTTFTVLSVAETTEIA